MQPQASGYPLGVSNTAPYSQAPLTKLYTMTAAGSDGTTGSVEIYDGSGYFFGEPLATGTGGPGQFTFNPSAFSTYGNVKMWSVLIAGFDITTANPDANANWTRISGTGATGQDATHLTVIDNGLVRVSLDKNNAGDSCIFVAYFNGTSWKLAHGGSANTGTPTILSVETNSSRIIKVKFAAKTSLGLVTRFTMHRAQPYFRCEVLAESTDFSGNDIIWRALDSGIANGNLTTLYTSGSTLTASDGYGLTGSIFLTPTADNWHVVPMPNLGLDSFVAFQKSKAYFIGRDATAFNGGGWGVSAMVSGDLPYSYFMGFTPRTYTLGTGVNSLIGHTDGQLVEGDYYNEWEGETPFVAATNLLTNGTFETDVSGWTQTTGTWTRVTTQKKFGTASVQVSSASASLDQSVGGLVPGAKYALTGWIRTAGATAGNANFSLGGASTLANVAFGKEWTYKVFLFTASATTHTARLQTDASFAGSVQFDGLAVYQVADASGNKKLAFQTADTSQWTVGTNASGIATLSSPRGSGIQYTASAQFGNISTSFGSLQDFSRYRYLSFWAKRVSGSGDLTWSLRQSAGSGSGQAFSSTSGLSTSWQFFTFDIATSGGQSAAGVTACGALYLESFNAAGTFAIANITLSERNMAVDQKHGLRHDFEESLVGWWKLDETTGNTGSNLVTNGGFETYTTTPGFPDNWGDAFLGTLGSQCAKETTIKNSGSNSVKITGDGTHGGMVNQTLTLTAGHSYYFEGYVRSDGTNGAFAFIRNTTDGVYVTSTAGTTNTSFTKYSGTFTAVSGKTYIVGGGMTAGTPPNASFVYVDDILVQEIVATDASGEGNNGTLKGGTNTAGPTIGATGKINTGYSFDGVDDGVDATLTTPFNPSTTPFTIEAWLSPTSVAAGVKVACNATNGSGLPYIGRNGSSARFAWFDSSAVQQNLDGGTLSAATYAHIVATFSSTVATLYVNGVQAGQTTGTTMQSFSMLGFRIGGALDFPSNGWAGSGDEVRLYTRALGPDEVAQRFNQTVHEIKGWYANGANPANVIALTTDKKEGAKALTYTAGANGMAYDFPIPQDWSAFTHLGFWMKTPAGSNSITMTIVDATGTTSGGVVKTTAGSSYEMMSIALTSFTGVDLTRINKISIAFNAATYQFDALWLHALNSANVVGQWLFGSSTGASLYTAKNYAPAANDVFTIPVVIPAIGKYYVGVMAKANAGTPAVDAGFDGTYSGTPATVPTTGLDTNATQLLFGPFDVTTAGAKELRVKITTLSTMTRLDLDFVALYPYQKGTTTPVTAAFPKDFAHSTLRQVTPV